MARLTRWAVSTLVPFGTTQMIMTSFSMRQVSTYRRPVASKTPWLRHADCTPNLHKPRARQSVIVYAQTEWYVQRGKRRKSENVHKVWTCS